MLPSLDTYNWKEAFNAAEGPDPAKPGSAVPLRPFGVEDVVTIIASDEGYKDASNWLIAGELRDGRYFYLSAGCDYTGWDCQCWGRSWVATSKKTLIAYGIPEDDKKRLGL